MSAAVLTAAGIAAAYRAALERYRRERHTPYKSHTEAERRAAWVAAEELPKMSVFAPEYRPAETLGEWLDDMVIAWGQAGMAGDPIRPLMVTLLEAARESTAAAAAVIEAAWELPPLVQWNAHGNLRLWLQNDLRGRAHGGQLGAALLARWERLGLPVEDPRLTPPPKRRRRSWEITETEIPA